MEQRRGDASGGEEEGQEELGQGQEELGEGAAAAAMHLQHVASAFAKVARRIPAPYRIITRALSNLIWRAPRLPSNAV